MAIILGIDPGSRLTGFGIIEAQGTNIRYLGSGCIRIDTSEDLAYRLKQIHDCVQQLIQEYKPYILEIIF